MVTLMVAEPRLTVGEADGDADDGAAEDGDVLFPEADGLTEGVTDGLADGVGVGEDAVVGEAEPDRDIEHGAPEFFPSASRT
jgi:hypothetical protein